MLTQSKGSLSNSLSNIKSKLSLSHSQKRQNNIFKPKSSIKLNLISQTLLKDSLKHIQTSTNKSTRARKTISVDLIHTKPMKSTSTKSTVQNISDEFFRELNEYEIIEVQNIKEVFYVGTKDNKIVPNQGGKNMGFDGESKNYIMIKGDHLYYRYEIISLIGQGTFGVVCECFDHKTKSKVAIKVIRNKKSFNKQAFIELSILKTIKESDENDIHPIIKYRDFFVFRNHFCLVFNLLSVSLYELIKVTKTQGLKEKQIKSYTQQILSGLSHLKRLRIIHCDLKPENILLTSSTFKKIKIIDLGSSCFDFDRIHTYIQSRYYRAPEIILGIPYTEGIDMWSLGCIAFEMITGKVLLKGDSELELLMLIIEVLGYPPQELVQKGQKKKLYFHNDGTLRILSFSDGRLLVPESKVLDWESNLAFSFVKKCLTWDPDARISPEEALRHPWLESQRKIKKSMLLSTKNMKKII